MASSKARYLRSSLAATARTARAGRLNEVRPLTSAHRATTDDDEENDDDEVLAPKVCPGCEYVNQTTSKYCSKCGTKLDKDTDSDARTLERKQKAQSKVLKEISRELNRIERSEKKHADPLANVPEHILRAANLLKLSAITLDPDGEEVLGLCSRAEAKAIFERSQARLRGSSR